MTRTAVIFSPIYYKHDTGRGHPENPSRLSAIIGELKRRKRAGRVNWVLTAPQKARISHVTMVHDENYVRRVEALCKSGGGLLDSGDTVVSPDSFNVALHAAGGVIKASSSVLRGDFENAFALVRPPGHHAGRDYGLGFCLFNNVAIACEYLTRKKNLKRVAIVDIDAHHGNGTQEIFYESSRGLYVSLHEDPRGFPGTGFIDEVGDGNGRGYNVNVPLPFKTSDQTYLRAMREVVAPIILEYEPQFMLVSAGLDCHYRDPIGQLAITARGYDEVFRILVDLAKKACCGRLVMTLEGGYNLEEVGKLASLAVARLSGTPFRARDDVPLSRKTARCRGERVIEKAKKIQSSFWNSV